MTPEIQELLRAIAAQMQQQTEGKCESCECDMEEGDEDSMCDDCWAEKKQR